MAWKSIDSILLISIQLQISAGKECSSVLKWNSDFWLILTCFFFVNEVHVAVSVEPVPWDTSKLTINIWQISIPPSLPCTALFLMSPPCMPEQCNNLFHWVTINGEQTWQSMTFWIQTPLVVWVSLSKLTCSTQAVYTILNDLPLAPEKLIVKSGWLSDYATSFGYPTSGLGKLVETLFDKFFHVCHFRNLKSYVEQGLTVTKLHLVLQFDQSCWLGTCISKNTEMRKNAQTDFDKTFSNCSQTLVMAKQWRIWETVDKPSFCLLQWRPRCAHSNPTF